MQILVTRFVSDKFSTVSQLSVDGRFVCFGLEDEFREIKLADETRIPAGTYRIRLKQDGPHDKQYAQLFPDIHCGMLELLEVPGFTNILIHCGNTQADTSGCLLVGSGAATDDGNMALTNSRVAYRRIYPMVIEAARKGELQIRIVDSDRGAFVAGPGS